MSTLRTCFALGLFVSLNACSVGTVTASSRAAGGSPTASGLGRIQDVSSSASTDGSRTEGRGVERTASAGHERSTGFRMGSDCWRCAQ